MILFFVTILTVVFFYETEDQYLQKIFIHQHGTMDWNWFRSRMILFKGKYIHYRNQDGETLLMKAAYGHGSMKILEILTKKGSDVNASDNEGMTPLMWAILGNKEERAAFLLMNGANVNAQDKKGNSPLFRALLSRNILIIKLLLKNGADANHKNNENEIPLLKSLELGDFLPPPEEAGEIACLLIKYGADVNVKNSFGTTPLMMAIRHGQKNSLIG